MQVDWQIEQSAEEQQAEVLNKLSQFNRNALEITADKLSSLALNYHVKDNKKIIAGINANLYFMQSVLHIDHLFVEAEYRGQRLGVRLLQKVENLAREKGVKLSHLDTYDFQAKDFYIKQGYEIFGVLEGYPPNHKRYFLKKDL